MIIAGIGSRETPPKILAEMKKIGQWIASKKNNVLRSGHADGADFAFEKGAQQNCTAYIPWIGFNRHLKSNAVLVVPEFTDDLMKLVVVYHPAPERLTNAVQKIMGRNVCQVLGEDLKVYSKAVVCWTRDGKDTGGTGQAIRIAKAYKIPVYNMHADEYNNAEKVIAALTTIR